ncbi:MAG: hypothetical protein M3Y79_16140 [Pseudomonadota bacterium]|nr:hypothetical protein [Pseudomonadota bacterium]
MTSMNFDTRLLAAIAVLGTALAGCDSIKDIRTDPYTQLPSQTVVLEGTIQGLGSRRSVVLMNNGDTARARSFLAPTPEEPITGTATTRFSFGALPVGTAYNIEVRTQPVGKTCTVANGAGTLSADAAPEILITCVNSTPRYSMTISTVAIAGEAGAKVTLATEENVYEAEVPAGTASVTFADVLFNPAFGLTPTQAATTPPFVWSVTASTTEGGTLNKCPVTNPTNPGGATPANPTADITNVSTQACSFTIGGSVAYSLKATGDTAPAAPAGLVLELRNTGEDVIATQEFSGAWGGAFTFSDGVNPVRFVSNSSAVYYVAVGTQPTNNLTCVVVNPMAILHAPQLTQNPTNIATPAVQCRERPAAGRELRGVYRHTKTSWLRNSGAQLREVTWDPFDFTKQNTASNNMLAFFEDGTFIYGTHANTSQVEHGFYEFTPGAGGTGTIRLTLNVDTASTGSFPGAFSSANATSASTVPTTTNGLNVVPGTVLVGSVRHAVMTNVNTDTAGVITGRFKGAQTVSTPPTSEPDAILDWTLEAPFSVNNEMTGGWLAQDGRRLWVYDKRTYYGTHVGVVGVYAVNDACFTIDDLTASSSFYTRRPSIGGCYPWPRPATGQSPGYAIGGIVESIDYIVPQFIGTTGANQVDIGLLPEFMSRLPGGRQAADGRSPSPIYFHIAPAAQFFAAAPAEYFPAQAAGWDTWCPTEILGIRSTQNGVPIHKPVYFCRNPY